MDLSALQLPGDVAAALRAHKHHQADINGSNGLAWVLSANVLFIWNYQDGHRAIVHSHALPYALSGQCHVSVIQHQVSLLQTSPMEWLFTLQNCCHTTPGLCMADCIC